MPATQATISSQLREIVFSFVRFYVIPIRWIGDIEYFRSFMLRVIYQTQSRVIDKINAPASDKVVSIFDEHTNIIVKSFRYVQYGHKVNLSTEDNGFIT